MGRAQLREQGDRPLEMGDGRFVAALGRVNASQSDFGRRLGRRLLHERAERPLTLREFSCVQQRFGLSDPRGQIVR